MERNQGRCARIKVLSGINQSLLSLKAPASSGYPVLLLSELRLLHKRDVCRFFSNSDFLGVVPLIIFRRLRERPAGRVITGFPRAVHYQRKFSLTLINFPRLVLEAGCVHTDLGERASSVNCCSQSKFSPSTSSLRNPARTKRTLYFLSFRKTTQPPPNKK